MIWFTSDPHYGHRNVIEYCSRPFASLQEMHEALIRNWNDRVQPDDTVYVLGDVAMCKFKDFLPLAQQLRGRKILIQGNHDYFSASQYAQAGFERIYHELKMKLAGKTVRLSHYPYQPPFVQRLLSRKSELRYLERRPPRFKGETLLHGHTHSKRQVGDGTIHVGVDAWNYRPVSAQELERYL